MPKFESEDLYTENKNHGLVCFVLIMEDFYTISTWVCTRGCGGVRTPFCRQMTFSE